MILLSIKILIITETPRVLIFDGTLGIINKYMRNKKRKKKLCCCGPREITMVTY